MIRREIRKNNFDANRQYPGEGLTGNPDDVVSIEVIRGGSSYDLEMISSVIVTYVDTTVETITIIRGANPPVANTVPDYEYINNALISGFTVETASPYGLRQASGEIVRENGYGKILRVNLTYSS